MHYLIFVLALLPATLWAQPTPMNCQDSEAHRQFDFWVGQWEVRTAKGEIAGHNTIESVQAGCALR